MINDDTLVTLKTFVTKIAGIVPPQKNPLLLETLRMNSQKSILGPQSILTSAEYCSVHENALIDVMDILLAIISQDFNEKNSKLLEAAIFAVKSVGG